MSRLRDDLIAARQRLIDVGWVQGMNYKWAHGGGAIGYCARGAVMESTSAMDHLNSASAESCEKCIRQNAALDVLRAALTHLHPAWGDTLELWNDNTRRTKEEVVALFDAAIATLSTTDDAAGVSA